MKYFFILLLVLCFNIGLTPLSTLYANAVPVEVTNVPAKKIKKRAKRKILRKTLHYKKKYKRQLKSNDSITKSKSHGWEGFEALVISMLILWILIAVALIVLGFFFTLPFLWIIGFCLLPWPLIGGIFLIVVALS